MIPDHQLKDLCLMAAVLMPWLVAIGGAILVLMIIWAGGFGSAELFGYTGSVTVGGYP